MMDRTRRIGTASAVAMMLISASVTASSQHSGGESSEHYGTRPRPRHCGGSVKHIHLAVGRDPSREMTVSFASKWSVPETIAPIGGVRIGLKPDALDRFVPEQEFPMQYESTLPHLDGTKYYAPFQHHITIDGLEPDTTYYYVAVVGERERGIENLENKPLRHESSGHDETFGSEGVLVSKEKQHSPEHDGGKLLRNRRLAPPYYNGSEKRCIEGGKVRSFKTAPADTESPVTFAIVGDLGQFQHSQQTLDHMRDHRAGIDAVILAGDIAYTEHDHRRWDTFFDFLDDFSIFDEVPLHVATGNHDIEKLEDGNEIFQAYETRFRMPQVRAAELGVYDFPGLLNMDAPPYPLPYDWGNAYYSFKYGQAKHIVLSAYSSMEPGSPQYQWLNEELRSVNRKVTPWVLVTIHTPLYNTFNKHLEDLQVLAAKKHLDPLFQTHHVNFVFTGHVHAYQRTGKVAMGKLHHKAPIHITIGAGGRQCDAAYNNETPEEWIEKRDASYFGYGRLSIFNKTHAEWEWIPLGISDKHPLNTVSGKQDLTLPSLMSDEVMVENQFFLQ